MKEVVGNLWDYPADVRVVTTNGTVKKDGTCVMGRGCAWECSNLDPQAPALLGHHIQRNGNVVGMVTYVNGTTVMSFPVKHNWWERADIELIKASAMDLVKWTDAAEQDGPITVVLPRPGCGNGKLNWERDVRPILEVILDDRFHVITFK